MAVAGEVGDDPIEGAVSHENLLLRTLTLSENPSSGE